MVESPIYPKQPGAQIFIAHSVPRPLLVTSRDVTIREPPWIHRKINARAAWGKFSRNNIHCLPQKKKSHEKKGPKSGSVTGKNIHPNYLKGRFKEVVRKRCVKISCSTILYWEVWRPCRFFCVQGMEYWVLCFSLGVIWFVQKKVFIVQISST